MSWPYGTIGPRGCLLLLDSRLSCIELGRGPRPARTPRPRAPGGRQVGHLQNTPPYWIADLPPSYAVATATSMAPDCQLPPPYSAVADVHAPLRVYSDLNKPASGGESAYIDAPPPPPPLASPALAPAPHAPPPPAPAHVDTAVAVDCDVTGSPLHVPSSDARPPTNHRSVGTRTATSVGTDAMHAAGCCCDACIEGPC